MRNLFGVLDDWSNDECDDSDVEECVRKMLTPGNLHAIGRSLVSSRVEQLAVDGVSLPDGLRLDAYTKVSALRNLK